MPEVYQITIAGVAVDSNYFVNTLHLHIVEMDPDQPYSTALNCLNWWQTTVQAAFLGMLPTDVIIKGVACRRVSGAGGPSAVLIINEPGTAGGVGAVAGAGACIALIPGPAPYSVQGHLYLPAFSVDDYVDGDWTTSYLSMVNAFALAALTGLTGSNITSGYLCIYKRADETDRIVVDVMLRPKPVLMNRRLKPVL